MNCILRWQTGSLPQDRGESTRSSRCGFVAQWLERATRNRMTLGSIPGGAALCFFSSDPAVSSSIFVGAEREENLIVLVDLQIFSGGVYPPSARTISFSISNSFWY